MEMVSQLFRACWEGDLAWVQQILTCTSSFAGPPGRSPSSAAVVGRLSDVHIDGITPLYLAAQQGRTEICQALIEEGHASVTLRNKLDGATPLAVAAQHGHLEVVRLLLAHGAADEWRSPPMSTTDQLSNQQAGERTPQHDDYHQHLDMSLSPPTGRIKGRSRSKSSPSKPHRDLQVGTTTPLLTALLGSSRLEILDALIEEGAASIPSHLISALLLAAESRQQESLLTLLRCVPSFLPDNEFVNLTSLSLSKFQLEEVPEQLFSLHTLTSLDLSFNLLVSLPEQISNLQRLVTLDLRHNRFFHLPEGLGHLGNLKTLNLQHNPLPFLPLDLLKKPANILTFLRSQVDLVKWSFLRLVCLGSSFIDQLALLQSLLLLKTSSAPFATRLPAIFRLVQPNGRKGSLPLFSKEGLPIFSKDVSSYPLSSSTTPPSLLSSASSSASPAPASSSSPISLPSPSTPTFSISSNSSASSSPPSPAPITSASAPPVARLPHGSVPSVDGSVVFDWEMSDDLTLSCLVLNDDAIRYHIYEFFLSKGAMYMIVFDFTKTVDEIIVEVSYWLRKLKQRIDQPVPVIAVGIRAMTPNPVDCEPKKLALQRKFPRKLYPHFRGFHFLSNGGPEARESLIALRDQLTQIALSHAILKHAVPRSFSSILNSLNELRSSWADIVEDSVLYETLCNQCFLSRHETFSQCLELISKTGHIVYLPEISNLVFLRPEHVMVQLSKYRDLILEQGGILNNMQLAVVWPGYPETFYPKIVATLEHLGIVFACRDHTVSFEGSHISTDNNSGSNNSNSNNQNGGHLFTAAVHSLESFSARKARRLLIPFFLPERRPSDFFQRWPLAAPAGITEFTRHYCHMTRGVAPSM